MARIVTFSIDDQTYDILQTMENKSKRIREAICDASTARVDRMHLEALMKQKRRLQGIISTLVRKCNSLIRDHDVDQLPYTFCTLTNELDLNIPPTQLKLYKEEE